MFKAEEFLRRPVVEVCWKKKKATVKEKQKLSDAASPAKAETHGRINFLRIKLLVKNTNNGILPPTKNFTRALSRLSAHS